MSEFNGLLYFEISLNPITKKNSNFRTKSGAIIPSKAYRQYESDALRLITGDKKLHISEKVNVLAYYYLKTDYISDKAKAVIDLNNLHNALHDVLVKAGVLADDNCRIIYSTDGSRVRHDKENPRTEVYITRITAYQRVVPDK